MNKNNNNKNNISKTVNIFSGKLNNIEIARPSSFLKLFNYIFNYIVSIL